MSIELYNIFGFPIVHSFIKPSLFNKSEIIKDIENNYKISEYRNEFDKESNLHHSFKNNNETKFKEINYKSLISIYSNILKKMFNKFNFIKKIKFTFKVVNYTCLGNSQYLSSHIHNDCDFTAVHYIQFDEKNHTSTRIINNNSHAMYYKKMSPNLFNALSNQEINNSWIFRNWILNVKEDDFVLMPAVLEHDILPQKFVDKKRITIVLNISIEKNES